MEQETLNVTTSGPQRWTGGPKILNVQPNLLTSALVRLCDNFGYRIAVPEEVFTVKVPEGNVTLQDICTVFNNVIGEFEFRIYHHSVGNREKRPTAWYQDAMYVMRLNRNQPTASFASPSVYILTLEETTVVNGIAKSFMYPQSQQLPIDGNGGAFLIREDGCGGAILIQDSTIPSTTDFCGEVSIKNTVRSRQFKVKIYKSGKQIEVVDFDVKGKVCKISLRDEYYVEVYSSFAPNRECVVVCTGYICPGQVLFHNRTPNGGTELVAYANIGLVNEPSILDIQQNRLAQARDPNWVPGY